ncbi:hypothetical protein I4U23_000320 [Adineta vaga]|nr:hypothetical protein I4U23_000320 [Adineta vaga]
MVGDCMRVNISFIKFNQFKCLKCRIFKTSDKEEWLRYINKYHNKTTTKLVLMAYHAPNLNHFFHQQRQVTGFILNPPKTVLRNLSYTIGRSES